ncbi:MAG: DUF11 domain-containing protein [Actinobacteria bacterium]|nr:DUF11 domain-containing protein [Actinomycetota bacterium]
MLGLLGLVALASLFFAQGALGAATGSIGIVATNQPPVPSGSAAEYVVNFTCSNVGKTDCGAEPTIRIPLELTSTDGDAPPMSRPKWDYKVAGGGGANIASTEVVEASPGKFELVIKIEEGSIKPGQSQTLNLSVIPPNDITPDGTAWSLTPEFETAELATVVAPRPATGEAEAKTKLSISKSTNDGGAVYVSGNEVIFKINARCNSGNPAGSLWMTEGSLVDQLPAGLEFVSATPAPSSAPAVGGSGPITWSFGTPAALPPGCGEGAAGAETYTVVATIPAATPNDTVLTNTATLAGQPIGETASPVETSAERPLTAITVPPTSPGNFVGKSAQGPLNIPGAGFLGTYPGNWLPAGSSPSLSPGSSAGRYRVTVTYPASRAFETALVDPVPCLEAQTGVRYDSKQASGPVGVAPIPLCAEPAFHPTVVRVESASLKGATGESWVPIAVKTDGTEVALTPGPAGETSGYFEVPAGIVGEVAAILLPPNGNLTDRTMNLDVFGYADASVPAGSDLHDIATATAYPTGGGGEPTTGSQSASLYVEPNQLQLGVSKSFGSLKAGPGGSSLRAPLNLGAGVTIPPAYVPPGNLVLTDLLPKGMRWANPQPTGTFSVQKNLGASRSVTGTVETIEDFEGSGRELIRVKFDPAEFNAGGVEEGFYVISPPANFFEVSVPNETRTYPNTAEFFAAGAGRNTATACGSAKGSRPAEFQSSDLLDLDGDGTVEENYCQAEATLATPGIGGPNFALEKSVQGALDPLPKGALGVGNTTPDGPAIFTLSWGNTGGKELEGAVIYEILPYVGDTGVDKGQAGVGRESEFATPFTGVIATPEEVTTEYSTSTNPCRSEVYKEAPGCVEDWSATPPADLGTVKALRFRSAATYQPGEAFSVQFGVTVPRRFVNQVAWNSAASDASFHGTALLPAEPPKVGITATVVPVTPTLRTEASASTVAPGTAFTDAIEIAGTNAYDGTIEWKLLGPVSPNGAGNCDGVAWKDAKVVDEGTIEIAADGTYPTPSSSPTAEGCYGYEVSLDGAAFTAAVISPAGSAGEVVLVRTPPSPPKPPTTPPTVQPQAEPHLTIVKRAASAKPVVGRPLQYTIEVHNTGGAAAHDVVVTDTPQSPMAFVSAKASKGKCGSGFPLRCEIGTLGPGAKATVKVVAKPLAAGSVVNGATVRPGGAKGVDARAKGSAVVPLRLVKRASVSHVAAGGAFRYSIVVGNPTAAAVSGAQVCDKLPAGVAYRGSSRVAKLEDGRYCWKVDVAPHGTERIVLHVQALRGAGGKVVNVATLSGPETISRRAAAVVRIDPAPPRGGGVTG